MSAELFEQFKKNVEPGPEFDDGSHIEQLPQQLPARLIAFFLPQFHSIPENDRAWGPGFTEWTNVTKTLPWFPGHYQPRLPGPLGFYDLGDPDVLRRQADVARRYGIHGFCFHYYWFGGRRLLERPLDNLLKDRSIDLPFCINWANENWTKRWDGREREILVGQNHSPEDDLAFAESVARIFEDPRYIRIAGRPLLLLYRPRLLPDVARTTGRWRDFFSARGEEPLLLMVQGFGDFDPAPFQMDGAVCFPPWGVPAKFTSVRIPHLFHPSFGGNVKSYLELAERMSSYWPKGYRFYPGVCPSWDNSARRGTQPGIFQGSAPSLYGAWLEAALRQVRANNDPDNRLVFINAWNEWAEGAYLEPDRHYGFAYLAETAHALSRVAATPELDAVKSQIVGSSEATFRPLGLSRRALRIIARKLARAADLLASW